MSTVYSFGPPTKGKVLLKTTYGDLDVELWAKEAPMACRNFVQLCLEGYYDDTIFHRIIKDFMAQAGDPTGTGDGGESIYGKPFKDEFHSRLRFQHRGIVACANANEPHTNGSQFFVTLGEAPWLDRKNTIFGKVTGDTLYNLMDMNALEVDEETDRPLMPPVIKGAEVLWNPFDDIVPRTTREEREAKAAEEKARAEKEAKKSRKKAVKQTNLLSFGDEAEEEDITFRAAAKKGMKISAAHTKLKDEKLEDLSVEAQAEHEAVLQKARDKARAEEAAAAEASEVDEMDLREGGGEGAADFAAKMAAKMRDRKRKAEGDGKAETAPTEPADSKQTEEDAKKAEAKAEAQAATKRRREEAEEMRRKGKSARNMAAAAKGDVVDKDLLDSYQLKMAQYRQKKRITGAREKDTMSKLNAFAARLKASKAKAGRAADVEATEADPKRDGEEAYDGQVLKDVDHVAQQPAAWRVDAYLDGEDEGDEDIGSLTGHKLKFTKQNDQMARREDVDDYEVVDPKLAATKEKFAKRMEYNKKQNLEWAGGGGGVG